MDKKVCHYCGQPVLDEIRNRRWYEQQICKAIGIPPDGQDVLKKDYWTGFSTKKRLIEIYHRINEIFDNGVKRKYVKSGKYSKKEAK